MSDLNKNIRQDADPEKIKQAEWFVKNLFALFKAVNLYPSGHKILQQTTERFYTHLKSIFDNYQTVVLRVFDNKLYFLELPLDPHKILEIKDFIEKMQKRFIRQIIFNNETNTTDINAMLTLLNTAPESISFLGGIHAILRQNGAKNIKVVEYYYKRRTSATHEWTLNVNENPILQFFIDDSRSSMPFEEARSLYDLLKETPLVCKLIKIASQYKVHNQTSKLPENAIILKIIKKIKGAINEHSISEDSEMKTILHDIITTFSDEDFFDLIFENPDDELINQTNVYDSVADKLGLQRLSEFVVQKISASKENSGVISQSKLVLKRILLDSRLVHEFLPIIEDTIQKNIPSASKAKRIINDICSSIDPDYYLKIDTELSLGVISETEKADIMEGLNILKTIPLKKDIIKQRVSTFDKDPGYFAILGKLIDGEQNTELFTKILDRMTTHLKKLLEENKMDQAWKIFDCFFDLVKDQKEITPAHKKKLIGTLATFPLTVIEELATKTFSLHEEKAIEVAVNKLLFLFPLSLMMLLIKRFISSSTLSNEALFRKIITDNYQPGTIKYNDELRKAPVFQIMRLLDILEDIKNDEMLPFLWELTFLENINISQKSLKIIALINSDKSLYYLLRAVDRSEIPLRITGLEYLSCHDTRETRSILTEISRGEKNMTDSLFKNINIRVTALRSLEILDSAQAVNIFNEILKKKKFFFVFAEPKKIRSFAEERLKKLS